MSENSAPFCICLAGPNGSGKSTFTTALRHKNPLTNWIDPDVIAAELSAQRAGLLDDETSRAAFTNARNRRVDYAKNLNSFGFETVFSHPSNAEFLDGLKKLGYVVHLYFICTDDPQINVGRVRNRQALGGHSVPEDKIVDRYYRSLSNLSACMRRFDRVVLLDNSSAYGLPHTVGHAVNTISATGIQLFPMPHLPDWVLDNALVHSLRRTNLAKGMVPQNKTFLDVERRKAFLEEFLI